MTSYGKPSLMCLPPLSPCLHNFICLCYHIGFTGHSPDYIALLPGAPPAQEPSLHPCMSLKPSTELTLGVRYKSLCKNLQA